MVILGAAIALRDFPSLNGRLPVKVDRLLGVGANRYDTWRLCQKTRLPQPAMARFGVGAGTAVPYLIFSPVTWPVTARVSSAS